jgi:RNase adapter protein RapZ
VALRALEDAGFYSIDNLPVALFDKLLDLSTLGRDDIGKLALVIDTRDAANLGQLPTYVVRAREQGHEVTVVFLDASDAALHRRFSETRRRHPLEGTGTVSEAIAMERGLLSGLRETADRIIDTSELSIHQLRREMNKLATTAVGTSVPLSVTVMSFGFKNGAPSDADLMFDVRFLPNPHFIEGLRPLTGEDEAVAAYVMGRPETQAFLGHLEPMLGFLLPQYEQEGKAYLTIAIGCTGGQHRSVAIAATVAQWLRQKGREVRLRHRDMRAAVLPRGDSSTR